MTLPQLDVPSSEADDKLASWDIDSRHSGALLRLHKRLKVSSGFRLIVLEFNDPVYRDRLIGRIDRFPVKSAALKLDGTITDFSEFERKLAQLSREYDAVHVVGLETWLQAGVPGENRLQGFNYHREAIAAECPAVLLLWMLKHNIKEFALQAPDMWAWRSDVLDFSIEREVSKLALTSPSLEMGSALQSDRLQRIQEIEEYLERVPNADRRRAVLLSELGKIKTSLGLLSEASDSFEKALEIYLEFDDRRNAAFVRDDIANIKALRGDLDEALELYKASLKVHEALGDVRERAVTMGKIADILKVRGQLDEALRIRREDELPVYERLGDVRERAVTMGQIADILQARGQLDEALRILRDELLPDFERLGDAHARVVTMGKIADILQARGQLDEALRIRREDQLPVYERLGDVRARAVTMGKIADILRVRGELDEALRIRREEELPVYERLGDVRARLVCRANMGILYLNRQQPGDRGRASELLRQALVDARRLHIPEAETIAVIMQQAGIDADERNSGQRAIL